MKSIALALALLLATACAEIPLVFGRLELVDQRATGSCVIDAKLLDTVGALHTPEMDAAIAAAKPGVPRR